MGLSILSAEILFFLFLFLFFVPLPFFFRSIVVLFDLQTDTIHRAKGTVSMTATLFPQDVSLTRPTVQSTSDRDMLEKGILHTT